MERSRFSHGDLLESGLHQRCAEIRFTANATERGGMAEWIGEQFGRQASFADQFLIPAGSMRTPPWNLSNQRRSAGSR